MATISHTLHPENAAFPTATFPELKKINGTNFSFTVLAYAAAGDEAAFWKFIATGYGSGNLTTDLYWEADTASTNDTAWGVSIAVITANTDSQDVETDSLATENTVTDTHLGTTGQRIHHCAVTVSNLDSLAAGDIVYIRIRRISTGDTMTGDALLHLAVVSYSDT